MKKIQLTVTFFLVLFFIFSLQAPATEKLTILHWNDFHSFNKPYETILKDSEKIKIGGYATLSGYIKQVKQQNKNVALVHAGDDFQGTPISTITKGMSQIRILNLIKPDVFTLGNHEFDYGRETLAKEIVLAKFPIISANIFDKRSGRLFTRPCAVKRYGNLKVGYIGLMTPILNQLTLVDNVKGLKIFDPAVAAQKYISEIKNSVDLVIIVSHMGVDYDKQLANKISGAHIIIGGHSHTTLFQPKTVNNIYICQAGSRGKYMGRIDLKFEQEEKRIVDFRSELIPMITNKIVKDVRVASVVDSLERIASTELDKVIGELESDWIRKKSFESNVGNWQADVMREFAGTDIAFQNSGGIRKNIMAGKITIRDMWELNPFSNYFGTFDLSGAELKKALERNVSNSGEFLQVSGLKYKFNPNNPVGNRVHEVSINETALDTAKTYSVCTNNFVIGIFYKIFQVSPENKKIRWLPGIDREIFINAVKKQKKIFSKIEGRMVAIY